MRVSEYEKRDDETYEAHAERIARAVGLRVEIQAGRPKCPQWGERGEGPRHCPYGRCTGYHGKHWAVALHAPQSSHTLSFWSSVADESKPFHKPTVYDVLSCLEWNGPTDPDEIAEEYGPIKPSRAIACAEQNRALRALFVSQSRRDALALVS